LTQKHLALIARELEDATTWDRALNHSPEAVDALFEAMDVFGPLKQIKLQAILTAQNDLGQNLLMIAIYMNEEAVNKVIALINAVKQPFRMSTLDQILNAKDNEGNGALSMLYDVEYNRLEPIITLITDTFEPQTCLAILERILNAHDSEITSLIIFAMCPESEHLFGHINQLVDRISDPNTKLTLLKSMLSTTDNDGISASSMAGAFPWYPPAITSGLDNLKVEMERLAALKGSKPTLSSTNPLLQAGLSNGGEQPNHSPAFSQGNS